jgi:hypothetical protein
VRTRHDSIECVWNRGGIAVCLKVESRQNVGECPWNGSGMSLECLWNVPGMALEKLEKSA